MLIAIRKQLDLFEQSKILPKSDRAKRTTYNLEVHELGGAMRSRLRRGLDSHCKHPRLSDLHCRWLKLRSMTIGEPF